MACGNISNFVQCAEMFSPRNIYISGALKHLYECANIYLLARIFLGFHANILVCAEMFWLTRKCFGCAEIFSLPAKVHSLPAENYMLRGNFFQVARKQKVCARKLLGPNHFRNAGVP